MTLKHPITCTNCGNETTKPILSQAGPHIKACCEICEKFIKFVPTKEIIADPIADIDWGKVNEKKIETRLALEREIFERVMEENQ